MEETAGSSETAVALFESVDQTAFGEVIRGEFDGDPVPPQNPDVVTAHLSGDMCQNNVSVFKFHLELGIGERFNDGSTHFNDIFASWFGFLGGGLSVASLALSLLAERASAVSGSSQQKLLKLAALNLGDSTLFGRCSAIKSRVSTKTCPLTVTPAGYALPGRNEASQNAQGLGATESSGPFFS